MDMSQLRRVVSSLPSWVALVGASYSVLGEFEDNMGTPGKSYKIQCTYCGDVAVNNDERIAREKNNLIPLSFLPKSWVVDCKSKEDPSPLEHSDSGSFEMHVRMTAKEIWALLDQHAHRLSGSLRGGHHHHRSAEAPIQHPEVAVDSEQKIFDVKYMIPREMLPPIDLIVKGLQLGLHKRVQQNVTLSKRDTSGTEGRAIGIRVQSSEYGSLTVDILQPFDPEQLCHLEFRGNIHEGNLSLMSDAIAHAISGNDRHQGRDIFQNPSDIRDHTMLFDSMQEMMRIFIERGMMPGGHFDSEPLPGFHGSMPEFQKIPKEKMHVENTEDNQAMIANRLESMGCQVYFPHPNTAVDQVDWGTLAGYEVQKKAIEENLLLPLRKPDVYDDLAKKTRTHYSSNRPRAVLFTGPPGTGKTSSARVIAQQASVPLCYIPLEALASKWYGESEKKLAEALSTIDSFKDGAVLFLDELDSLATTRGSDMHEATRRTLGVLLRHLDGFDISKKTVVIGATNRPDDLDSALRSRFSATIQFGLPTNECRMAILKQYAKQLSDEDIVKLATVTEGMSGRDLRDICEVAERHWATMIIQGQVSEDSLPGLDTYLASTDARRHSFGR